MLLPGAGRRAGIFGSLQVSRRLPVWPAVRTELESSAFPSHPCRHRARDRRRRAPCKRRRGRRADCPLCGGGRRSHPLSAPVAPSPRAAPARRGLASPPGAPVHSASLHAPDLHAEPAHICGCICNACVRAPESTSPRAVYPIDPVDQPAHAAGSPPAAAPEILGQPERLGVAGADLAEGGKRLPFGLARQRRGQGGNANGRAYRAPPARIASSPVPYRVRNEAAARHPRRTATTWRGGRGLIPTRLSFPSLDLDAAMAQAAGGA